MTAVLPALAYAAKALAWPDNWSYSYLGNYPRARDIEWGPGLQGISADAHGWFISQERTLWRLPYPWNLNRKVFVFQPPFDRGPPEGWRLFLTDADGDVATSSGGGAPPLRLDNTLLRVAMPRGLSDLGLNHFGDIDVYQGILYAPLERKGGGRPVRIAAFDVEPTTLRFRFSTTIPQDEAPWCAINPLDGLLYSSNFDLPSDEADAGSLDRDRGHVRAYRRRMEGNRLVGLDLMRHLVLRDPAGSPLGVRRIQGGAFSPNGHLYLVSDVEGSGTQLNSSGGGLMGFDVLTGRRHVHVPILYDRSRYGSTDWGEELEGLAIVDLDAVHAPCSRSVDAGDACLGGRLQGQFHIGMLDNADGDIWIKHIRAQLRGLL